MWVRHFVVELRGRRAAAGCRRRRAQDEVDVVRLFE